MIIKKYTGGQWVAQSPKVTYTDIVDDVTAGTPESIFSSGKLRLNYLPDAVFDSLIFHSTFNPASSNTAFADKLEGILASAASANRSVIGYYLAASGAGELDDLAIAVQGALSQDNYFTWSFDNDDSGSSSATSTGALEAGDWIVITEISGTGAQATPYAITFGVVNNVYEIMDGADGTNAGASGLVPAPTATDNGKFLRGDGTWATPDTGDNTTYTIGAVDSGADAIIRLTGSDTTTDDVKLVSGSNIALTPSGDNITIDATNTTYTVAALDGTSGSKIVRLSGNDSSTDDITFTGGSNVTISRSGDQLIFASTNTTYTASDGLVMDGTNVEMVYPLYVAATDPTGTIKANALAFVG